MADLTSLPASTDGFPWCVRAISTPGLFHREMTVAERADVDARRLIPGSATGLHHTAASGRPGITRRELR